MLKQKKRKLVSYLINDFICLLLIYKKKNMSDVTTKVKAIIVDKLGVVDG